MIRFDEIVSNFEKTLELAYLPIATLTIAIVEFEEENIQINQRLREHPAWFQNHLERIVTLGKESSRELIENPILLDSGSDCDILVLHSCAIGECPLLVLVCLNLEQQQSHLLATAICQLLAEAVSNNWILSSNFSPDNLCRTAGRVVMQQVMGLEPSQSQSLFLLLDRVAFLPYEDRKSYGSIVFSGCSKTNISEIIHLLRLTAFSSVRGVRKLLEIGKDKFCLLATENGIYGFGLIEEGQEVVKIDFRLDNSWILMQNGQKIYQVRAGLPAVYRPKLDAKYFCQKVQETFPHLSLTQVQYLQTLLSKAIMQPHGTNILITEDAHLVAQRLDSQCTLIKPVSLTIDIMEHISRIDGTVIMEPGGICVGFGAILDGMAARFGDSARGGRYNSAVMFCENSRVPCLMVVVSQDGTIDIISSVGS